MYRPHCDHKFQRFLFVLRPGGYEGQEEREIFMCEQCVNTHLEILCCVRDYNKLPGEMDRYWTNLDGEENFPVAIRSGHNFT